MTIKQLAGVIAGVIMFFCLVENKKTSHKKTVRIVALWRDADNSNLTILEQNMTKRFSLATAAIIISFVALTVAGAPTTVDGALMLLSSDESVLTVTPLENGLFQIDFVGVGNAQLTVTADKDLSDEVKLLVQNFDFEIYDQANEADHFDFNIVEVVPRAEQAAVDTAIAGVAAEQAADLGGSDAATSS